MAKTLSLIGLFAIGQVAALQLLDARPYGVFQHYLPWQEILDRPRIALLVLVAQTGICLWIAGYGRLATLVRRVASIFGPWRLMAGAGALAFMLAVPTESVARFGGEVLLAAWIALSAALNLYLIVCLFPRKTLSNWRDHSAKNISLTDESDQRPWDRRLPWLAALWVGGVSAFVAWFVLDGLPHIDDSVVYLFQAKYFSVGQIALSPPPDLDSFAVTHLLVDGHHWYGKFFPGWPTLLAVGVLIGVPWLVNPLVGALTLPLAHTLVRRLYGRGTANVTTLLLATSPWLLFMSSSFMAHGAALVWALIALLAIDLQRGRRAGIWSVIAGLSFGALFLTRPFEAAIVGSVGALWALGVGGRRLSFGSLASVAVVAAAVAALMLPYQAMLTGHATVLPHSLWAEAFWGPGVDVFGFGPNVGIPLWRNIDPLPGHGLADVFLIANKNLNLTSFELFGWATGSLILTVVACLLGPWKRADVLFFGLLAAVVGGHAFYWTPGGPDFGARYWYQLLVPLTVMTVRGAQNLAERLGSTDKDLVIAGPRMAAAIVVASLVALVTVVPWRSVGKYRGYRGIRGDVRTLAEEHGLDGALVFVHSPRRSDYQSAFSLNPPTLDHSGTVYARDAGREHRELVVRHFPDRPIWLLTRSVDGGRPASLVGPLPPGTTPEIEPYEYEKPLQADVR